MRPTRKNWSLAERCGHAASWRVVGGHLGYIAATRRGACAGRVTRSQVAAAGWPKVEASQLAVACHRLSFERKFFVGLLRTLADMKFKPTTKLFCLAALCLVASFTPNASAFTYKEGDLLLTFRKTTFNDVEFNLGSVSNYLGLANGTTLTVTNFRLSAVTSNFNNNLSGVFVSLLAVTAADNTLRRAWVTDTELTGARQDITGSKYSVIRQRVEGIGQAAVNYTLGSLTNEFVIGPSDSASYTYGASNGGVSPDQIPSLSGAVPFTVDNIIATTLRFFELKVSGVTPKPDAAQVGSFSIALNGVITFTAGSGGGGSAPSITSDPANVTVFAGGVATFSVGATGATGYQWQFNNANIAGAIGSTYNLTAHSTNAGGYRALVSNGSGSVTSAVATLTVNLPSAASLGSVSKPPGGPFQLKLTGTAAAYYEIQSNTNLNFTNWTTVAFITNSGGMTVFSDPSATNRPQTFYRAIAR